LAITQKLPPPLTLPKKEKENTHRDSNTSFVFQRKDPKTIISFQDLVEKYTFSPTQIKRGWGPQC
jgi:hypothetical protein